MPITISSADAVTVGTKTTVDAGPTAGSTVTLLGGVDFHHTSTDEKAIQGSTPHLYMAWSDDPTSVYFAKFSYSGGSWTAGADPAPSTPGASSGTVGMVFDGTRVVISLMDGSNIGLFATQPTPPPPPAPAAAPQHRRPSTYDNEGNVWVVGVGGSQLKTLKFIRATLAWATIETLDTDNPDAGASVRRYFGNTIAVAYGSTTGYGVSRAKYDQTLNNVAPSAPTWVNTDNVGADVGAALTLDWNFVDGNPADTQTAYTLRRQIGAGAYAYWKAGTATWDAAVQKITSSTSAVTLASGWGRGRDANHKFAVLVYDNLDTVSVYSAELTVTPSVPSVPVITTPADAGTVGASWGPTTVWTCTGQATYKVELLDSAGTTVLHSSGVVTNHSVSRSYVIPYTLVNGTSYKVRVTTSNSENLTATPDTNSFSVSCTLPATPGWWSPPVRRSPRSPSPPRSRRPVAGGRPSRRSTSSCAVPRAATTLTANGLSVVLGFGWVQRFPHRQHGSTILRLEWRTSTWSGLSPTTARLPIRHGPLDRHNMWSKVRCITPTRRSTP